MHTFKSAILAIFQFWQMALLKFKNFGQKTFLKNYEDDIYKNIANMSQGPPNPGFVSIKVENWYFLKKDSQDFKKSF